jgi:hypothetical protein
MHFLMICHPNQAMNLYPLVAIHQRNGEQSFGIFPSPFLWALDCLHHYFPEDSYVDTAFVVLGYRDHSGFEAASKNIRCVN